MEHLAVGTDHIKIVREFFGARVVVNKLDLPTKDHERVFAKGMTSERPRKNSRMIDCCYSMLRTMSFEKETETYMCSYPGLGHSRKIVLSSKRLSLLPRHQQNS